MTTKNSGENMTSTAHLTIVRDETDPADALVDLIAAHVAAATSPVRLARAADPAVTARVKAQAELDTVGLPRGLHRIEDV